MSNPEVSIIMLGMNGWDKFSRPAIKSLFDVTEGENFELVFVDNGSTDGTDKSLELIAKKNSRIVPVLLKENLGFSGGNIEGFKKSKGKYVVFINNDVLFSDPKWISKLLDEKKKNSNLVLGQQLIAGNMWTAYRNTCHTYLGGWLVFASREDFEKVGPWDINFGMGFFEDSWLSIQFKDLGYELKEIPLGVEHLGSKTVSKMNPDMLTMYAQKVYKNYHILREKKDKLRIVFFFHMNYPFVDSDYEGRGVGGSEGSIIQLMRELAKKGHVVEIYNDTNVEGCFNGVYYYNIRNFDPDLYCDVFVLYRNIHPVIETVFARTKIFYSCDQYTNGDYTTRIFPFVDKVICISDFHKKHMVKHWGANPKQVAVCDMGVKYEDYIDELPKTPNKMIFCSVPERGLKYMPEAFKLIKQQVPDASLVVTSDYTLWGSEKPLNEGFRASMEGNNGVTFLGKVSREVLVYHQKTSEIMAYPCDYDENFCISAAECMAVGTVPVTSKCGALPTTVGKQGVLLQNMPEDQSFVKEFVIEVVKLLKDRDRLAQLAKAGRTRAMKEFPWRFLVDKYLEVFTDAMEGKEELNMVKCNICKKKCKSAFDMFRHRNKDHAYIKEPEAPSEKIMFRIKTNRRVQVSIGRDFWEGQDFLVPSEMAGEIVRIITDGYGPNVVQYEAVPNVE